MAEAKAFVAIPHCTKTGISYEKRDLTLCKDCKWNSGTPKKPYCQKMSKSRPVDWFCGDGEERDD